MCVRPDLKPRRPVFSQRGSYNTWRSTQRIRQQYHACTIVSYSHMSRVMRKPTFCICENKDADQLRGNLEADQHLCFRYIDSTITLLSKSETKPLAIFCSCTAWFVSDQVGNHNVGFLMTRLIYKMLQDGCVNLQVCRKTERSRTVPGVWSCGNCANFCGSCMFCRNLVAALQ